MKAPEFEIPEEGHISPEYDNKDDNLDILSDEN